MIIRLLYTLGVLLLAFIVPLYGTVILCIVGAFIFKKYFESLIVISWYEIVFTPTAYHVPLFWTCVLFCIVCGIEYIRPFMRNYHV